MAAPEIRSRFFVQIIARTLCENVAQVQCKKNRRETLRETFFTIVLSLLLLFLVEAECFFGDVLVALHRGVVVHVLEEWLGGIQVVLA